MTAETLSERAAANGVKLLHIQCDTPNQNVFIERFNRCFREELCDAYLFNALADIHAFAYYRLVERNGYRLHESLGDIPPIRLPPGFVKPRGLVRSTCHPDGDPYASKNPFGGGVLQYIERDTPLC